MALGPRSAARGLHLQRVMSEWSPRAELEETRPTAALLRASREEALALWQQLLCGEWSILDRVDDGHGRSFVLARFEGRGEPRPWHRLSARERSVVAAVAAGSSNRQVACALGISVSTVAGHLRGACRKLGGARRLDLVREWRSAIEAGEQRSEDLGG